MLYDGPNSCLLTHLEGIAEGLSRCESLQELSESADEDELHSKIILGPAIDPDSGEDHTLDEIANLGFWIHVWPTNSGHTAIRRPDTSDSADITSLIDVMFSKVVKEHMLGSVEGRADVWKWFADKVAAAVETEIFEQQAAPWITRVVMPGYARFLKRTTETAQGSRLESWYQFAVGREG